jgi:pimeloyl-ACP methyl ester carboxylesterase
MKAIVQYQGHLQTGQNQSGTEDLHFQVTRRFANEVVTVLHPRRWNSDIEEALDMLVRQAIHEVALVGYSWGAGFACMKFAELAPEWGIKVPLAVLCDPVYRPLWMPRWLPANPLNIGSVMRSKKIEVPISVRRVVWVRQNISLPAGHALVPENGRLQHIADPLILPYSHTGIDEAPEWFDLVRRELRDWTSPPKAELA